MIFPVSIFVSFTCLLAVNNVVVFGERRTCTNGGTMLSNKIMGSPIIVFGEVMEKRIYNISPTELLFSASFHVDCVMKGSPTERIIQITDAGIKMNSTACQYLQAGQEYVVFLEKWKDAYRPTDFQELTVSDNITVDLLQKTCQLARLPPIGQNSIGNCPNVSVPPYCFERLDIMSKHRQSEKNEPHTQLTFNSNQNFGNFQSQHNVSVTDGKLKIADKKNNGLSLHHHHSNNIIFLIMAYFIYLSFLV